MSNRENEKKKRPRSLLSFANQPEPAAEQRDRSDAAPTRDENSLEHYHRMRALRLAAGSEIAVPSWSNNTRNLTAEEAEQEAVDRMRADMAAIKAELNRRVDAQENLASQRQPAIHAGDTPPVVAKGQPVPPPPGESGFDTGNLASTVIQPAGNEGERPAAEPADPAVAPRSIGIVKLLLIAVIVIGMLIGVGYGMIMPVLIGLAIALLAAMVEGVRSRRRRSIAPGNDGAPTDPSPSTGGPTINDSKGVQAKPESRLGTAIRRAQTRDMTLQEEPGEAPAFIALEETNTEAMLKDIADIRAALKRRSEAKSAE